MLSKNEWLLWTRGRAEDEREHGLTRRLVKGYDGLAEKWGGSDEYAAIFSKAQLDAGEFDTILMDIDAHNGESWQDKVDRVLRKVSIAPSRIYVTGRGAHLYWDLEEAIRGAGRYKQVVAALVKKWGIGDLVDMHVTGDIRRVARLPMSKNSKGGYAVRISQELLSTAISGEPETLTSEVPKKIQLVIGEAREAEKQFGPSTNPEVKHLFSEAHYPPCIRIGIRQMMETGELDHAERLHVFSFLVANDERQKGWELLKQYAGDFDPNISEYQLNRMEQTGHKMFKCSNVPHDLCPYSDQKDCTYYPSINVWRQKRLEREKQIEQGKQKQLEVK